MRHNGRLRLLRQEQPGDDDLARATQVVLATTWCEKNASSETERGDRGCTTVDLMYLPGNVFFGGVQLLHVSDGGEIAVHRLRLGLRRTHWH
eukprot:1194602-Prorocentrum_minimum.AAC.2